MTKQVYIGNLPYETTEDEVRRLCSPFGDVESVAMIMDRDTRRFRGFCFVEMDEKAAQKAIAALNGAEVGGRQIRVSEAKPRKNKGQGRGKKRQGRERRDTRPLHERTGRGAGNFPDSGGSGGRQRQRRDRDSGDSEFPHSGGRTRR